MTKSPGDKTCHPRGSFTKQCHRAMIIDNQEDGSPRQLGGSWQGKVKVSADFDEIDPGIAESFYNSRLIPSKS